MNNIAYRSPVQIGSCLKQNQSYTRISSSKYPKSSLTSRAKTSKVVTCSAFEFATAGRIIFGRDTIKQVPGLADSLLNGEDESRKVLVVTGASDRFSADLVASLKAEASFESITFHVEGEPTTGTVQEASKLANQEGCGLVVSIGGGSALDTGKAVAAMLTNGDPDTMDPLDFLEIVGNGQPLTAPSVPFIACPTTAGVGAEVTRNAVLGAGSQKVSMRSPYMLPSIAVIDPLLTVGLPPEVTAHSGLDALVQCIEPFCSNKANLMSDQFAMEGMRRGARSLARAFRDGSDLEAREDMCACSLMGGLALANSKLGSVHGFAGTLGGMFPAPHGAVCAALLTSCFNMNMQVLRAKVAEGDDSAAAFLSRFETCARILTNNDDATLEDAVEWIQELVDELAIPGLGAYGVQESDFEMIVKKSSGSSSMQGNPIKLSDAQLAAILRQSL